MGKDVEASREREDVMAGLKSPTMGKNQSDSSEKQISGWDKTGNKTMQKEGEDNPCVRQH